MFASLFSRLIACVLLCAAAQAHALTAEAARAIVGIVMVIVAAIAYVVAPGIVDGILGNGCI